MKLGSFFITAALFITLSNIAIADDSIGVIAPNFGHVVQVCSKPGFEEHPNFYGLAIMPAVGSLLNTIVVFDHEFLGKAMSFDPRVAKLKKKIVGIRNIYPASYGAPTSAPTISVVELQDISASSEGARGMTSWSDGTVLGSVLAYDSAKNLFTVSLNEYRITYSSQNWFNFYVNLEKPVVRPALYPIVLDNGGSVAGFLVSPTSAFIPTISSDFGAQLGEICDFGM